MKKKGMFFLVILVLIISTVGYFFLDDTFLSPQLQQFKGSVELAAQKFVPGIITGYSRKLIPPECRARCEISPMLVPEGHQGYCEFNLPGWNIFEPCGSLPAGGYCECPVGIEF